MRCEAEDTEQAESVDCLCLSVSSDPFLGCSPCWTPVWPVLTLPTSQQETEQNLLWVPVSRQSDGRGNKEEREVPPLPGTELAAAAPRLVASGAS